MATAEAPPGASGSGRDLHSTSPAAGRLAVESSLLPKHVLEARKKFNTAMDDHLLDYKHNHPMHVDNCANTLIRIFSNVLDNPGEAKYRQVHLRGALYVLKRERGGYVEEVLGRGCTVAGGAVASGCERHRQGRGEQGRGGS